ncbi:MAG: GNAT family N-acetyltransferase [Desulfobulbaceae bacterium]|nr:GNAT family N-acetyltransferase [Desulfobulbaceae bacterium]
MLEVIKYKPERSDIDRISVGLDAYNVKVNAPPHEKNHISFKAVDGDKILGEAFCNYFLGGLEVKQLCVSENTRGKGVGKFLLAEVEKFASKNNIQSIIIWTASWQGEGFYEKAGFVQALKFPLVTEGYFDGRSQFDILYHKSVAAS